MTGFEQLPARLDEVRRRIGEAAARSDRSPDDVRIVGVTKGHPLAAVRAATMSGLVDVGENRLEEMEEKQAAWGGEEAPRWHMIGHLQSRKAPAVRGRIALLHSLDSIKLARRLERTAEGDAPVLPVLVQVNTSGEEAKYGFSSAGFREALPELLELASMRVEGLMTMAPLTSDTEVLRSTFRRLRELHEEQLDRVPAYRGTQLSMGMSNDYEVAVEEGSTLVRLGTILFGERGR
ncbi:MAG: YggS family pyridoxal phosphate-dependent enzyme [Gemmatimonadota bacterium]